MIDKIKYGFHRFTHSRFLGVLILKWEAITVSLVAFFFGWFLIIHPQLLNYSETYEVVSLLFTSQFFGFLFICVGLTKILSIVFNSRILKVISICLMFALWMFFGSALLQSGATNTVYIHSFGWAMICFGVVLREMLE